MNLKDFIEKEMDKLELYSEDYGDVIRIDDAVEVAYKIMRDMGCPDNLDIEIEDETETN